MLPPQLPKRQQTELNQASRTAVRASLSKLRRYFSHNRWIGNNNTYWTAPARTLRQQKKDGQNPNQKHLAEYIAASSPLHCADGWEFLGRAIHCHALGDYQQAQHLAYYAELRGAMSLLASEGIGVFNNPHIVLDQSGNCMQLPGDTTHVFTWLALEHWAGTAAAKVLVEETIRAGGIQLFDWIREFGAQPQSGVLVKEWLTNWGLDLKRFSMDRDARNEASYRPGNLRARRSLGISSAMRFMIDIWQNCQPDAPSTFGIVDRHLLRIGLEVAYSAAFGRSPKQNRAAYRQRIEAMIGNLPISKAQSSLWTDFLVRKTDPGDPELIVNAKGADDPGNPKHHMQVIARAALLLRVATGACNALLVEAGFNGTDLDFWVNGLGESRGLWSQGNSPLNIADLWADVDKAIGDLFQWEAGYVQSGAALTHVDWLRDCAREMVDLGRCERIALWGITP